MVLGTAALSSDLLTFVTSERAIVDAGERRTSVRVVVSHASTVLSCFLVVAECSMRSVVFFIKLCYINFRIGIIVHNIDHNSHYCPS